MVQTSRTHFFAYIVLILVICVPLIFFVQGWPDRTVQRLAILALSGGYFLWGVITHFKTKKITCFVVKEYAAVAFLGGLVLLLLTF